MTDYKHVWYTSHDGLKLYARDYHSAEAKKNAKPTVLCMHGLTRNSADFEDICHLLSDHYRLIVADQRGRGLSAYDAESSNYQPAVYVQDMFALLQHLNISVVTLMGTSMGGIMAMMMSAAMPNMVRGLIINDIGPELDPVGLARIKGYVGKPSTVSTWEGAAQQIKQINSAAFPGLSDQDWDAFARRTYRADDSGIPVLAYDSAISAPIKASDGQSLSPDLWPMFMQSIDKPMLLIRGELSDLLASSCVTKMRSLKQDLSFVEVPNVGHAPLLNEAMAVAAIKQFLQTIS